MLKGFTIQYKPLEILSEEDLAAIHRGVLDVLFETGVKFQNKKALELFKKNDCVVNEDDMLVKCPPGLVEECLRKCPSSFRVKARDPRRDLVLGGSTMYFSSSPGMQTVDIDTWEPKIPTKQDYIEGVKVLDALKNHHLLFLR